MFNIASITSAIWGLIKLLMSFGVMCLALVFALSALGTLIGIFHETGP